MEQVYLLKPKPFTVFFENPQLTGTNLLVHRRMLQAAPGLNNRARNKKLAIIEAIIKARSEKGETVKRRIKGTGLKTETTEAYLDTEMNRRLCRVGVKYAVTRYENAQYEDVPLPVPRRRKRKHKKRKLSKRQMAWIEAQAQAKKEMGIESFVASLKALPENPTEKQAEQHRFYLRSKVIHAELLEVLDAHQGAKSEDEGTTAAGQEEDEGAELPLAVSSSDDEDSYIE